MAVVSYRTGAALVLLGGVLWSLMGLGVRLIDTAGTWQILLWRSLGLVPVLLLVIALRSRGETLARLRAVGWPGLIGGTALAFSFAGAIYAFQTTTVANATFLFAASPLLTALLAWPLLGEPVRKGTMIAIAIAAVGMLLMVRDGLALGALAGNLAALGSAAGFAVFTLALRRGRLADMLPAVALAGTIAGLIAAAAILAQGQSLAVTPHDAAIAIGMGALLLGGGLTAYTAGSRALPAADLALFSMTETLLAPLWVWVLLAEGAGRGTLIGGAILLAALVFNAITGMRHRYLAPV